MSEFDGVSEYHQSGLRRLRDAEELLQPPRLLPNESGAETRHPRGAMYLAGYALECALKAYLLSQSREKSLSSWLDARRDEGRNVPNLLGAEGHNLIVLMTLAKLEERLLNDTKRKQDWGVCAQWKSILRYESKLTSEVYARDFVAACQSFYPWVSRQLD